MIPANEAEIKTKVEPLLKCILIQLELSLAGANLSKLSILCLYLRIFPGKKTRIAIYSLVGLVSVLWISWAFLGLCQCSPVQKQ